MNERLIPLNEADVRLGLGQCTDIDICLYDEIDSTNNEARRRAGESSRPILIAARSQTAGRGRLGRSFFSPPDTGLYMTLLWRTDGPLDKAVAVTAATAVAVSRAISTMFGLDVGIKWVNDLYLHEKKLCGILTEAITPQPGETYIAVGIGINLTTAAFPSGLRAPAISLAEALPPHKQIRAGFLCGSAVRELRTLVEGRNLTAPATLAEYRRRLILTGRQVTATRGEEVRTGIVRGVDDAYGLLLDTPEGPVVLHSGEISVR